VYYQPPRALGLLAGVALTLWAAGVAILLGNFGLTSELGVPAVLAYGAMVIAGLLAAAFAYWTFSLATLSYAVDRNGLVINWGLTRQVVPLQAIERLVPGTSAGVPSVRGISWLGYHIGRGQLERVGEVLFYSTHQAPDQVLYVMTSERNYAISVPDPVAFAQEIQRRQDLGPTAGVTHHVEHSGASFQAFWRDRLAVGLSVLALAAGAGLWGFVAVRWTGLPPTLELHFPPSEQLPLVPLVPRDMILEIPRAATAVLAVNLALGFVLYLWERVAGYVLFLSAAGLQVLFAASLHLALRGV
jgi:hypothetical protein